MILKKYLTLIFLLFTIVGITHAQLRFAIDTTDKRINNFRHTIRVQQNIVLFIEQTLVQQNIPKALRNLALIESAFNNKALSWANAAGIWQLTPAHAAGYGLTSADRYDVLKSTKAAAKTIINLYNNYKDWRIVVAAYNCGEGNVNKAIRKAGSQNFDQFSYYLPAETKEHVYKFLLACYATNEMGLLNLPLLQFPRNLSKTKEISSADAITSTIITGSFQLPVIAKMLEIKFESIRTLNPYFKEQSEKNDGITLVLPIDKMPDFLLMKNEILTASLN